MKIALPPLESRWRLTDEWTPPNSFLTRGDNDPTIWGTTGRWSWIDLWKKRTGDQPDNNAHGPHGWLARLDKWRDAYKAERGVPRFLAGTVLQVERYHVSRSGENQITLMVLASPEPLLTPKKLKGKMTGHGRIYFTLEELNSLPELEEANDLPD